MKQTINYDYFKRQEMEVQENNRKLHRYILLGNARVEISGMDLYKNYFNSIYTKKYLSRCSKQQLFPNITNDEDISIFFQIFLIIMKIKYTLSIKQKVTKTISLFLQDMFDSFQQYEKIKNKQGGRQIKKDKQRNNLKKYYKQKFTRYFELEYKKNNMRYIDRCRQKDNQLKKKLQNLKQNLINNFQSIKERQILPQLMNQQNTIDFLIQNYNKINRIQLLFRSKKRDIFQIYGRRNRSIIKQIIYIDQILKNNDQNYMNRKQQIIMQRYTNQKQPILIKLQNYITYLHRQNNKIYKLDQILLQYIRNLVAFHLNYRQNTTNIYPKTKISDIYCDQKQLKLIVSYHPLIYDMIGIKSQSKSLELLLATQSTPNFNFQDCYLQLQQENRWKLNKKYYINNSNGSKFQVQQQWQQQRVQLEEIRGLEQNISVWRILCQIYYILNNKHLSKEQYNRSGTKEFRYSLYKKIIKKLYNDISLNPGLLYDMMPILRVQRQMMSRQQMSKQQNKLMSRFDYRLNEIRQLVLNEDDDSLLQNIQLLSLSSQFRFRQILIKQLNNMLSSKIILKRFLNIKKYLLLYFISVLDMFYNKKIILNLHEKRGVGRYIRKQMDKQIRNLILNDEYSKRKSGQQSSLKKIIEYQQRKDSNKDYLANKPQYYNTVKDCKTTLQILQRQQEIFYVLDQYQNIQQYKINEIMDMQQKDSFNLVQMQRLKVVLELVRVKRLIFNIMSLMSIQNNRRMIMKAINIIVQINNSMDMDDRQRQNIISIFFAREYDIAIFDGYLSMMKNLIQQRDEYQYNELLDKLLQKEQLKWILDQMILKERYRKILAILQTIREQKYLLVEQLRQEYRKRMYRCVGQRYNNIKLCLLNLYETQVYKNFQIKQYFHKSQSFNNNETKEQIAIYYNNKINILLKMYINIDGQNWRRYQRIFYSIYYGGEKITLKSSLQDILKLNKKEIKLLINRFQIIQKQIEYKQIQRINQENK